jgi:hypothetical protein
MPLLKMLKPYANFFYTTPIHKRILFLKPESESIKTGKQKEPAKKKEIKNIETEFLQRCSFTSQAVYRKAYDVSPSKLQQ